MKAGKEGFQPPTVEASEYKLFATELSRRLADAAMDIAGPGSQLRVRTEQLERIVNQEVDDKLVHFSDQIQLFFHEFPSVTPQNVTRVMASSCSRNGIKAAATDTICCGATSM